MAWNKTGEAHHNSRLTERDVRAIRAQYTKRPYSRGAGETTIFDLAREFDTTPQNISLIVRRETWRHVT